MTSRAAVTRWFHAHVGATLDTYQVMADGRVWSPGPRVLTATGKATWSLNGSEVRIMATHVPVSVTDQAVTIEWRDEDGDRIHTTTYTVV